MPLSIQPRCASTEIRSIRAKPGSADILDTRHSNPSLQDQCLTRRSSCGHIVDEHSGTCTSLLRTKSSVNKCMRRSCQGSPYNWNVCSVGARASFTLWHSRTIVSRMRCAMKKGNAWPVMAAMEFLFKISSGCQLSARRIRLYRY
jgi:hypothetical protein